MAGIIRAQVALDHDSNLPKDRVMNVFHFQGAVPYQSTDSDAIFAALDAFYQSIESHLSIKLAGSGTVTQYYLDDAEPRTPVAIDDLTTLTVGSGAMPEDVALCLSFQGVQVSGEPQARKRGRVYIGPITSSALVSSTGLPTATAVQALADAGAALRDDANTSWGVYSRVDDICYLVNNGWVDFEWDTQRRRGYDPASRQTW